ncbi:MAG TPA: glycine--tRNA ligase subunit beta, partial [Gammaproteobacteria bacterium]|nr:glycine--tRNA ligase subunit beta [Gammaproteobacteria bacterium]
MSGSPARDLLIEIGTEELPAAAQLPLATALADALGEALDQCGLAPASLRPFAAPRRLAVLAQAVPSREPPREIERRGPNLRAAFHPDGTPTAAAIGFARSVGVKITELVRQSAADGERLVYRRHEAGRPLDAVLLAILPELFATLPLPQRMRWGSGEASFLRPVRWLTLRYGRSSIPLEAFGLRATGKSRGHRLHHPGPVAFATPASYEEALQAAKVLADPTRREAELRRRVMAVLEKGDRVAAPPPGLYEEITGLVEWPVALTGRFDERYLTLPDAVLVTTLAHHQRLIPVRDGDGHLQPEFVAVVDIESSDPDTIRQGLERVVRSRLEDAAFYYRRDRERALGDYLADLEGLAFGRKLGN